MTGEEGIRIFSDREEPPNLPSVYFFFFEEDIGKAGDREMNMGPWKQGFGLWECPGQVWHGCAGGSPGQPGDRGRGSQVQVSRVKNGTK